MMALEFLIISLLVIFVFGWNNGSVAVGALTGPRLLPRSRAVLLVALGLVSGALAEGWKMNPTLLGATESKATASLATLLTTLILLTASNITLVPISLSNITVGAYVGILTGLGDNVNLLNLILTIAAWLTGPFITFALTLLIYKIVRRYVFHLSLPSLDLFNRLAVYVIVFAITYSLAANNIGFILGFAYQVIPAQPIFTVAAALSAVAGVFLMLGGIEASMAEKLVVLSPQKMLTSLFSASIVMWFFTQFSIPGSLTQNLLGGIIGAAASTRIRIINLKAVGKITVSWIITGFVSVAIGYLLAIVI